MKGIFLALTVAALTPSRPDPEAAARARREHYIAQVRAYVDEENKRQGGEFPEFDPTVLGVIIDEFSANGIDPLIGLAVAAQESRFDNAAVSRSGAMGIFQFMPATAKDKRVDPFDVRSSARGAARFLNELRNSPNSPALCGGDFKCALYHYNTGPSRRKGLRQPTRYANEVMERVRRIAAAPPSA